MSEFRNIEIVLSIRNQTIAATLVLTLFGATEAFATLKCGINKQSHIDKNEYSQPVYVGEISSEGDVILLRPDGSFYERIENIINSPQEMKKALAENLTMVGIHSQDTVNTLSVGTFQGTEENEVDLITTIERKQGWTSFVFPSRKFALNCIQK